MRSATQLGFAMTATMRASTGGLSFSKWRGLGRMGIDHRNIDDVDKNAH